VGKETDNNDKTQSFIALTSGTSVLHYKILEKIGAGGMGEVYLADDTELDRKVALKFLPALLCQDEDCRKRFKREAQAAAKLNHPNIVTIHNVSEFQGRPFFVMEYVEGRSLKEHIQQGDIINERIIAGAIQICDGLQAAHSAGVIHRDIKPSNIILDVNRRPRILDFGLAAVSGTEQLTKTGSTMGTLGYMSPEQISGQDIDHRSDLFSLGVILYELFSGHRPFRGDNEATMLHAILNVIPEPLTRYNSSVSDDLQRVISKLLEKDRELRYQSAAGLMSDLKKIAQRGREKSSSSSIVSTDDQPSVAVLPFIDMSPDKDQEYFCDGIAEEVINSLTQLTDLKVAARILSVQLNDRSKTALDLGRELGVSTVLEGSVRKLGNRLRITAQLVSISDGFHIWSGKFDRELDDIFEIQDQISLAIVENLKIRLLKNEKARIVKRYTENQEAYNQYLKGRYFWNRRYEGGLQRGIECFQKAINCDPDYALAYSGMADCYGLLGLFGYVHPKIAFSNARIAADKAIELDDSIGEAHSSMAFVRLYHDWNWQAAESEFKRAISLAPKYATTHEWYGMYLSCMGRFNEAVAEMKRAQELTPLEPIINTLAGLPYLFSDRYEEAIAEFEKTIEIDPEFSTFFFLRGQAYIAKKEWDKAICDCEHFVSYTGGSPFALGYLGGSLGMAGRSKEALGVIDQLRDLSKDKYVSPYCEAVVYIGLGQRNKAFEFLNKAVIEREPFLVFIKHVPYFNSLHSDARFSALLKKIGLE